MDPSELKRTIIKGEIFKIDIKDTEKKMGNLGHRKIVQGAGSSEKISNVSEKSLKKQQ